MTSDSMDVEENVAAPLDDLDVTGTINVGPIGVPTVVLDGVNGLVTSPYIIAGNPSTNVGMVAGLMDPSGDAPYTVTLGAGAGSGTSPAPSYTMKGSLVSGRFTIQTGDVAPPIALEVIATFAPPAEFNALFNTCSIIFNSANIGAISAFQQWVELDTSGPTPVFKLVGTLLGNTECTWHYTIIGNVQGT